MASEVLVPSFSEAPDAELWRRNALGCIGPRGLLGWMIRDSRLRYAAIPRALIEHAERGRIDVWTRAEDGIRRITVSRRRGSGGLRDYLDVSVAPATRCAVLEDWWLNAPRTRAARRGWAAVWVVLAVELKAQNVGALIAAVDRALAGSLAKLPAGKFPLFETMDDVLDRHSLATGPT